MLRRLAPRWLSIPVFFALLFLLIPMVGILVRADWSSFGQLLTSPSSVAALWLSLKTCLLATGISMLLGIPLAYWLATAEQGQNMVGRLAGKIARVIVTLPLVLPPVVAGLALLIVFGRTGLIGQYLSSIGIEIGFTTTAVVMAQVFVSMPYLVVAVEGALRTRGFVLERAALQLGASRSRVLRTITLPLMAPAIASGAALTFARALGEFGATLTFAGSLQGVTRTLPLEIYLQRESDTANALALAVVLIVSAGLVVGASTWLTNRWQRKLFPESVSIDHSADEVVDENGFGKNDDWSSLNKVSADLADSADKQESTASPLPPVQAPTISVDAQILARNFDVQTVFRAGQCAALLGPNGAGKSTLIELISGDLLADNGPAAVEFSGADGQVRVISLSQRALLFPHMSVLENVTYGLRARGISLVEARSLAQRELVALGIGGLAPRPATHLSGGQAQRVAIARAMVLQPDVILLDEPMAALDVDVAEQLRDVLASRLRLSQVTAVMVTHDLADVAALADRAVLLENGRVVQCGSWQEILDPTSFTGTDPRQGGNPFLLKLLGLQQLKINEQTRYTHPLELQIVDNPHAQQQAITATVERNAWHTWGAAVVARTADGQRLTFPAPQGPPLEPGTQVLLALDTAGEA